MLRKIAELLRDSCRQSDTAARYGGEEFVVLLPEITESGATSIAARIISSMSEPFDFAPDVRIGASIGIAMAPRDGTTADELLNTADRALYEAKRRGRNRVVAARPGPAARRARRQVA